VLILLGLTDLGTSLSIIIRSPDLLLFWRADEARYPEAAAGTAHSSSLTPGFSTKAAVAEDRFCTDYAESRLRFHSNRLSCTAGAYSR
jgi:hypothetical protein